MAEQAERAAAQASREPAPKPSTQRHEALERRAARKPATGHSALLNARPAGPRPTQSEGIPEGEAIYPSVNPPVQLKRSAVVQLGATGSKPKRGVIIPPAAAPVLPPAIGPVAPAIVPAVAAPAVPAVAIPVVAPVVPPPVAVPKDVRRAAVLLMFNQRFNNRNFMNLDDAFSRGSPWVVGQEFNAIVQRQAVIDFLIQNNVLPAEAAAVPAQIVEQLRNTYETEHNSDNDYHE